MSISPGDRVGIRGYGPKRNIVAAGPYTVSRRPENPYNQHMWEFSNHKDTISEALLFPWRNGLRKNDPVPTQKTLANVTRNKTRNQAMREVWEKTTGTSSGPGTGPINIIKQFNGTYKKHNGGKKNKTHRKTRRN
jgi:hypothetical protein